VSSRSSGFYLKCLVCEQLISKPEAIALYLGQGGGTAIVKANTEHVSCVIRKMSVQLHFKTKTKVSHIIEDIQTLFVAGDYSRIFCLAKVANFMINNLTIISFQRAFFEATVEGLFRAGDGVCNPEDTARFLTAANDVAAAIVKAVFSYSTLRFRSEEYPARSAECFIFLSIDQFFVPRYTAGPLPDSRLYTEWRRDVQAIPARSDCNSDKLASVAAEMQTCIASLSPYCADSFSAVADLALFHIWIAKRCTVHTRCPHPDSE
jgi:hypothetical protein